MNCSCGSTEFICPRIGIRFRICMVCGRHAYYYHGWNEMSSTFENSKDEIEDDLNELIAGGVVQLRCNKCQSWINAECVSGFWVKKECLLCKFKGIVKERILF